MTILYILLALLMLGILITVHEFGHFISARACGIAVKEFSIGFGPKLYQHTCKTGMLFSIRPIPLGGYCMFYGDTDDDPNGEKQDDPRAYNRAPVWKRMISVFSGPMMNFVLAFVVAVFVMGIWGASTTIICPYVAEVTAGSPAEEAGLQAGDRFVSIGGISQSGVSASGISFVVEGTEAGAAVPVVINRNGEEITLSIAPKWSEEDQRWLIGITVATDYTSEPIGFGGAIPAAWDLCKEASVAIVNALGQLVTTGKGFEETSGPVGVVQVVAQQTQTYGIKMYLYLLVVISVNLGLMNLLPIPGLDGSRLVFQLIELIRGKPVKQKVEAVIHLCGYALLIALMVVITGKDILKLFQ